MRTAYLTFTYPAISQTFVVWEVQALRRLGFEIETWGIRRPDPELLLTDEYRAEADAMRALRPIRRGRAVRSHLRALYTSPRAYAATLHRALTDRPPGLRALRLGLAAFGAAVWLWRELDANGIRHIHVHFAGSPTHIAALTAAFGTSVGRKEWTWSVSVHGPVEFADLTASRLPERIRDARFVIAVSDFARSQLLGHLPADRWDKVRVVRCGVRPRDFAGATSARTGGPLRILCVGRLIALKGQPVLVEALADLRDRGVDAHLTLVGDGPAREELERLANGAGLSDRITFAGPLGHDAVRERYLDADVFCLPSFAEGVPVVLMEAMAAGLAVVSTTVAGVGELVAEGKTGLLVRPGRADLLADALASLAADPERRRAMGERGRARVESDYDAERNAAQLAAVHRELRPRSHERVDVGGCNIDRLGMAQTVARCEELIAAGDVAQHVAVNAAKVVAMRSDAKLRTIVEGCELVSADGQSVVWASRMLGDPLPERVAGIDLMDQLLALSERRGYRVYFLGAREDVLREALDAVRARHPTLNVAGHRDGYFPDEESTAVADEVRASSPDILFVAMPSPKKEYWLAEHGRRIGVPFVMGVGGSVDVLAGRTRRAPAALQRLGMEWSYRLAQEPRRLMPRYLVTNAAFCLLVLRQRLDGRRCS